ncbi:MAG: response regulator [Desulfobacterales bacterium]|nr:response regulator [Desulfobacterales bacterium]
MSNKTLLIVDDEPSVISSLKRQLRHEGYTIYSDTRGNAGLDLLQKHDIGVVVSDLVMPEMDGVAFLEAVKQQKPDVVRIIITGYNSLENSVAAINRSQIFAYLTKPWSPDILKGTIARAFEHYDMIQENRRLYKLTHEQNQELKRFNANLEKNVQERTAQLEETVREGVVMLALAAEAKDDQTGGHVQRIYDMTYKICLGFGMSPEESEKIGFFSIMHDVGKIHIPDNILKKPASLNKEEWNIMKTHTIEGEKILGNKPYYQVARDIARSHHERWDGNGYPDGLKDMAIPLAARIVTVADIFDALTHERPYKKAWPVEKALNEMKSLSGSTFDPEILDAFFNIQTVEIKEGRKRAKDCFLMTAQRGF